MAVPVFGGYGYPVERYLRNDPRGCAAHDFQNLSRNLTRQRLAARSVRTF
jgi:hypothetical protein